MASITQKQQCFIDEYLIDLNGTQAAIRAGYSAKTANEQAARLLAKASIARVVAEAMAERAKKAQLTAEWVLEKLKDVAERCLSEVKPVLEFDHQEKRMVETGEYQFDSTGANRSLELIGKHLGMFKDKVELTGKDGGPVDLTSAKTTLLHGIVQDVTAIGADQAN